MSSTYTTRLSWGTAEPGRIQGLQVHQLTPFGIIGMKTGMLQSAPGGGSQPGSHIISDMTAGHGSGVHVIKLGQFGKLFPEFTRRLFPKQYPAFPNDRKSFLHIVDRVWQGSQALYESKNPERRIVRLCIVESMQRARQYFERVAEIRPDDVK